MMVPMRTQIIDFLEEFCKVRDVHFVWSQERRPDGTLTVYFKRNGNSFSHRFTNDYILGGGTEVYKIVEPILERIEKL